MKQFFILLVFSISSLSQTFQWVNWTTVVFPVNPYYVKFISTKDNSGNLLAGSLLLYKTYYSQTGLGDVVIKKFTPSGIQTLSRTLTGKGSIGFILSDASGNIYIAGEVKDTLTIDPGNIIVQTSVNLSSYIIKFSPTGQFIWKKNLTDIYGNNYELESITIKNNTLLIGIGNYMSGSIKKLDLNGNELQSISINPTNLLSGIDMDNNGFIYAAGACFDGTKNFGGLIANAPFDYNKYIVKFSPTGTGIWVKFMEDITHNRIHVTCDNSNNIISSGTLMHSAIFGSITVQGPHWINDFFVAKQDSSGNFIWVKEGPNAGGYATNAFKPIAIDNNNNVYFAGLQKNTINWGQGIITSTNNNSEDLLVIKYDPNGNINWAKTAGGSGTDISDAITISNDYSIYLSGRFSNTGVFDSIIAQGSGIVNSYFSKLSNPGLTSIDHNTNSVKSYSLSQNYPNPFNPITSIKFQLSELKNVMLKVYDVMGREVEVIINESLKPGKYEIEWDAANYSSGVYYYQLIAGDFTETKKMILIK